VKKYDPSWGKWLYIILSWFLLFSGCSRDNKIETWPAPPGLATSDDFTLKVNGQPVWVEKLQSNMDLDSLPPWFTSVPYTNVAQQVNIANFNSSGPLQIVITCRDSVKSFAIHPYSRNITAQSRGKQLLFELPGPDKLYIEINDYPALCLFANPPENGTPKPGEANVLYYGPGVHQAGIITLQENSILYLHGGAIVYGALRFAGNNIRITGRGILDGNYQHRLVLMENAANVHIDGVILRNGRSWQNTLVNCKNVSYENVKVISFGNSGDGINPVGSSNVTIDNCFLRCTDDCIAIKSPGTEQVVDSIRVTNNTMIGYAFSDGLTIGFETNGPAIKNVLVNNCDILMSRGGSMVDGHSAFSIICDGPAHISDIYFENIRVEETVEKLFELNITDGAKYEVNPQGYINGVYLKNITWNAARPIILSGYDANHLVENVFFENCTIAGRPLQSVDDPVFQINNFVRNVVVQ